MSRKITVLIADKYPIVIDTVKMAMHQLSSTQNTNFEIHTAHDCENAYKKIKPSKKSKPFDVIILDINIPPSKNYDMFSGEDICIAAKKICNKTKIIVFTSQHNNHMLYTIIKTINPEGFLLKTDTNYQNLLKALEDVINGLAFYSKTIMLLIRNQMSSNIVIDQMDRKILYYLSLGTKMKDLPNKVSLSLAGIERRKRHLREVFNTTKQDDKALIESARKKGFI
ncbi:hypothetical protein MHTCC0001_10180 [Flavobacteriaceae bacterium MHTCC 0001]